MAEKAVQLNKGTFLYVGNFELPDKGASANRVMSNRLLFAELGYRTAFLGVSKEAVGAGITRSDFDQDTYQRSYPGSVRQWIEHSTSIRDIAAAAEKYPDLKAVILYNCPYALTKNAYKYFSKKGIKVVYDCTEWNPDTEGNTLKRWYKKYDAKCVQYRLKSYADGFIAVSSAMYKQYAEKPTVLLPPLVDIQSPLWTQTVQAEKEGFEFCYAGDPGKKDDLCKLIQAFRSLADANARLRIIGLSEEEFTAEHPEFAGNMTGVTFTGRLSHEEVIRSLLQTDCFVFLRESTPRTNAGFPTKFAEAYTSGAQVIATDISDIRSFEEDNICVLSAPDLTDVAAAMQAALKKRRSEDLRERFDYRQYIASVKQFLNQLKL